MAFPLRVGDRTVANPRDLGALFIADARAGGGTVVGGRSPSDWAGRLVQYREIPGEVAAALIALVLGSRDAAAVAEGARLVVKAPMDSLAGLFPAAVDAQDVGVLLHPDPFAPGRSVEDALLTAWAAVVPDDADVRGPLLERLRNAGLPDIEVDLLARHGSPAELAELLPLVFIEGVPPGAAEALTPALKRGDRVLRALHDVFKSLPTAILAEIARRNPSLAGA